MIYRCTVLDIVYSTENMPERNHDDILPSNPKGPPQGRHDRLPIVVKIESIHKGFVFEHTMTHGRSCVGSPNRRVR